MNTSRRSFLTRVVMMVGGSMLVEGASAQDQQLLPKAAGDSGQKMKVWVDSLPDPTIIGQPRDYLDPLDNDPTIIEIERRLRCTCGCTLDIYTCRTTDFTCTYSPALHREIRGLFAAKQTPEEIIAAMVSKGGPQMLLAPPGRGFNLAGYLLPGLGVTTAILVLSGYLLRKRTVEVAKGVTTTLPPDPAAIERLRRALDDVES